MDQTVKAARVAGAVYLSMVFTAPFALMYVPGKLIVRGNASATANNIAAHEMLFRWGILADIVSSVIFILLGIALYHLFKDVSKTHAWSMVGLVLVSATITLVNVVNETAALILFRGADFLAVFDKPQRDALGMLFLRLHSQGIFVNEMFWGLWLFPFGLLVMKSRFLPRILGILLIVNGAAYVAISITALLWPLHADVVSRAAFPALLGELWIMLWLLIKGARVQTLAASAR